MAIDEQMLRLIEMNTNTLRHSNDLGAIAGALSFPLGFHEYVTDEMFEALLLLRRKFRSNVPSRDWENVVSGVQKAIAENYERFYHLIPNSELAEIVAESEQYLVHKKATREQIEKIRSQPVVARAVNPDDESKKPKAMDIINDAIRKPRPKKPEKPTLTTFEHNIMSDRIDLLFAMDPVELFKSFAENRVSKEVFDSGKYVNAKEKYFTHLARLLQTSDPQFLQHYKDLDFRMDIIEFAIAELKKPNYHVYNFSLVSVLLGALKHAPPETPEHLSVERLIIINNLVRLMRNTEDLGLARYVHSKLLEVKHNEVDESIIQLYAEQLRRKEILSKAHKSVDYKPKPK